jgi:predicted Fe-Mo cluster-binding NifX family protein
VINKTREVRDELVNVVVPNNLGDPKANAFDTKVIELVIHMKHQISQVLQPFLSFMHVLIR